MTVMCGFLLFVNVLWLWVLCSEKCLRTLVLMVSVFAFWTSQENKLRDREREREFITVPQRGAQCFQCKGSCRVCFCGWAFVPLVRQRSRWSRAAVCLAVMQRVLVLSFNLSGIVVAPCSTPCGPTDDVKLRWDLSTAIQCGSLVNIRYSWKSDRRTRMRLISDDQFNTKSGPS